MNVVLGLFAVQGVLGAFDTLYYHEWRARLPALPGARTELVLHGARSSLYAVLFGTLPHRGWHGAWAGALAVIVAAEIVLTLSDFVVEDRVRRPRGGVFPGERVMHAIMGIVYGAALANLAPLAWAWASQPTALVPHEPAPDPILVVVLRVMALGVAASGLRDLAAAAGLRGAAWPWAPPPAP